MVSFISLQDLNNRRFCSFVPLQDFKDGRLLFLKKFLVTAGFVLLRDFNDGRFCSVNNVILIYHVILVIALFFHYKISKTVSDGRFTRPQ